MQYQGCLPVHVEPVSQEKPVYLHSAPAGFENSPGQVLADFYISINLVCDVNCGLRQQVKIICGLFKGLVKVMGCIQPYLTGCKDIQTIAPITMGTYTQYMNQDEFSPDTDIVKQVQ